MHLLYIGLLCIGIIVLCGSICLNKQFINNNIPPERFDLLPAANYFSSDEPDYFFYDPIIEETDEQGKRYIPKNVLERKGQENCTDNECVIGYNNYTRYYNY